MDAAVVVAASMAATGVAVALVVRAYAGVALDVAPGGPLGRLQSRLRGATGPGVRRLAPLGAWVVVLIAAGWVLGIALGAVTDDGSLGAVDWFAARRTPWLTRTMAAATWLGDSSVVLPIAVVAGLLWWWRRGDGWALNLVLGAYLGSAVAYSTVKFLVARARPVGDVVIGTASGAAYPSGHAANATAVYLALLVVALTTPWGRRHDGALAAVAGALIALVASSRIYLGVHWLPDVLVGALIAGLWLGAVVLVLGADPPRARRGRAHRDR